VKPVPALLLKITWLIASLFIVAAPGKDAMSGTGTSVVVEPEGGGGGMDITTWGPVALVALAVIVGIALYVRQPKKT